MDKIDEIMDEIINKNKPIIDHLYDLSSNKLIDLLNQYHKQLTNSVQISYLNFHIQTSPTIRPKEKAIVIQCIHNIYEQGFQVAERNEIILVTFFIQEIEDELIYISALDNSEHPDYSRTYLTDFKENWISTFLKVKPTAKPWELIENKLYYRELVKHWHSGLPLREIAEKLEIPYGTLKARIYILRKEYGEDVVPYRR